MKIAIFGGRFDPPHIGHLKIAREILNLKKADEVWFVPDNFHQWNPIVASAKDRLEMLELTIKNEFCSSHKSIHVIPAKAGIQENAGSQIKSGMTRCQIHNNMKVNDIAIQIGGVTETIRIVRELKKIAGNEYFFICGSDQLVNFFRWSHWNELERELKFLIIPRKGFPIRGNLPLNYEILDDVHYQPLDDSSTEIRNRIKSRTSNVLVNANFSKQNKVVRDKNGLSIAGLVTEGVEEYILKNKLYR